MCIVASRILLCSLITLHVAYSDEECSGEPVAVPNSKVHCTYFAGCQMTCKRKYLFPTGEKNVYFQCSDGKWTLQDANPEDYTQCKAQCKPPCSNGGNCVRPNYCDCTTAPGYEGKRCQKKIICEPECLNDGLCIDNICWCAREFSGQQCEITTKLTCESFSCKVNSVCIEDDNGRPACICKDGFQEDPVDGSCQECLEDRNCGSNAVCRSSSSVGERSCQCIENYTGDAKVYCRKTCAAIQLCVENQICEEGSDNAMDASCKCLPGYFLHTDGSCHVFKCEPPCENGGKCFAPGVCVCPRGFGRARCQVQRCTFPRMGLPHSSIGGTLSRLMIKCHSGYRMQNNATEMLLLCPRARWMTSNLRHVFTTQLAHCYPICQEECLNGGKCIAPDACDCPTNFSGSTCKIHDN